MSFKQILPYCGADARALALLEAARRRSRTVLSESLAAGAGSGGTPEQDVKVLFNAIPVDSDEVTNYMLHIPTIQQRWRGATGCSYPSGCRYRCRKL